MDIYSEIEKKLNGYGINIRVPVKEFIDITSNLYHKHESLRYDATQLALFDSVEFWEKAFSFLNEAFDNSDSLKVLDFGCGTGFATKLLLQSGLKEKCRVIYCYDLSPDMIEAFRASLPVDPPGIELNFLSDSESFSTLIKQGEFDIILTNSILHHIPVPEEVVAILIGALKKDGYYISGHEPNRSFYFNRETKRLTTLFRFYKRLFNRFSIRHRRSRAGINRMVNTTIETNNELIYLGIINKPIPNALLVKLIDIHVPVGNSTEQCWGEIGFDRTLFEKAAGKDSVEIPRYYTYSHIKDPLCNRFYIWRKLKQMLADRFPGDGGDFLAIIKKVS